MNIFKKYKNRPFKPRFGEHYGPGDMIILHHKGLEYKPGMCKEIKKLGRRKYITKAVIEGMGDFVMERPYHQFILARRDSFFEWLFAPLDRAYVSFTKRFQTKPKK